MRINYLSPRGVLEVEHAALREIEAKLPREWSAYAAFRLVTRGSKQPLDIDLLLLTTNRILVVELKNWSGEIEYSSGQWFHRGDAMPSPVVAIAPCRQDENRDRLVKRARLLLDAGFNRVFLGPYQPKQECFEVLLIPGIFGVATYQWVVPSADRYTVPLGFVTQSDTKLQKMVEFTRSVLVASLYGSGWGNTPEDHRFWFNDADVSDFSFLDSYVTMPRIPAS